MRRWLVRLSAFALLWFVLWFVLCLFFDVVFPFDEFASSREGLMFNVTTCACSGLIAYLLAAYGIRAKLRNREQK
jgi:hypothetical protein